MKPISWVAPGAASLLLLGQACVDGHTVLVLQTCAALKVAIETQTDTTEELHLFLLDDGANPFVCNENIVIDAAQTVQIAGAIEGTKTEVFLDAEDIVAGDGDDFVGNLFRSSGNLHLENLQFNFDPEGDTTPSGYGTRIVQNAGSLSISDCSFIGTRSAEDQAYLLGHVVGT